MDTWKFIVERFPLKVTIPLVAILCIAPLSLYPYNLTNTITSYVTMFIGLLALRIADDIASIDIDRKTSPERGLPSGRIDPVRLSYSLGIQVALIVLIDFFKGSPFIIIVAIYYLIFFRLKKNILLLIRPFLSNLAFGCIPAYISHIALGRITFISVLFGLFTYISVIAHEFAHSVDDRRAQDRDTYSGILGAKTNAIVSLVGFIMASVLGIIFWLKAGRPMLFIIMLVITTIHIIYLETRLIKNPISQRAKPFYIYGFTFFLLPSLALIFQ